MTETITRPSRPETGVEQSPAVALSPVVEAVHAAFDIGRSQVKIIASCLDEPTCFPAGAAPASAVPTSLTGTHDGQPITIDGVAWYAALEPSSLDHPREFHRGYEMTDTYLALFLQALATVDKPAIESLVLGVPSDSFTNGALIERMKAAFIGVHDVCGKSIEIKSVMVADQPLGSLVAHLKNSEQPLDETERAIVVDIGFGTSDIASIVKLGVDRGHCFSSNHAMSEVVSLAAEAIKQQHGFGPNADEVDWLLRSGKTMHRMRGQDIDVAGPVAASSIEVAGKLVGEIRTKFRSDDGLSRILMAGGGSRFMKDAFAKLFAPIVVEHAADSDFGNVQGFYLLLG